VPARETGVLQADLACPATGAGVTLERNATLLLNGHRVTGGMQGIVARGPGRYRVLGPGEVSGAQYRCITGIKSLADGSKRVNLSVSDVTVSGCPLEGIVADRLDLRGVTVARNGVIDPLANTWSGSGIWGDDVRMRDSLVEQNALGIRAGRRVRMESVIVRDNRGGVAAGKGVTGIDVTVTGNWTSGIVAGSPLSPATLRLTDSVVTGNAVGGDYRDLVSVRAPRLKNTACGTSAKMLYDPLADTWFVGGTWGVCADD
jgi:hypothetical protein